VTRPLAVPRIFLSFRKVDERVGRDRVYRALVDAFGTDQVFKSGVSIPAGVEFADVLLQQAAGCEVMVVLIGPRWVGATGADGARLLDREDDWVRREITTSFRSGNRVIPVLLGDATRLPAVGDVPAELAQLAGSQFIRVEDSNPGAGLASLVAELSALLPGLARDAADGKPQDDAAAPPAGVRQTAKASRGSVAINVGGNLHADRARFIGGDGQGD
jgi:hypothetical protein